MITPDQPANTQSMLPEDEIFPFPSIVGEFRLTLAPAEVALRLAVPEVHILALISRGFLKTRREPMSGGEWITMESLKQFLRARLTKPLSAKFSRPQDYVGLRWFHQEVALSRGEAWEYLEADAFPQKVTFVPTKLQVPPKVALTPEQIEHLVGWPKNLLAALYQRGQFEGLIDVRAGESDEPMIRMPIESYGLWIKMILTCGPNKAGESLSDELRDSIYRELTQFLHAVRPNPDGHDRN